MELMPLEELCDHLEYARQVNLQIELERLDRLTHSAMVRDNNVNSRFSEIRSTFQTFRNQFDTHLQRESGEFFPFIRRWLSGDQKGQNLRSSLQTWMSELRDEHYRSDEMLADLQNVISNQSMKLSGSQVIRLISKSIERLDKLVQEQIYKENQVLFPRILAIGNQK